MSKKRKKNSNRKANVNKEVTPKKPSVNWKLVRKIALVVIVALITIISVWDAWANAKLELNVITIREKNLPGDFDGFRIAHISDFHSAGRMTDEVVALLEEAKPDIICITGDLIDSRSKNPDTALALVEKLVGIAQCYFVAGNHEFLIERRMLDTLLEGMANMGVILVMDDEEILEKGDSKISLAGYFWSEREMIEYLSDFNGYRILMSHYPEDVEYFQKGEYDLVLSGHAHGGQFRLPLIGGLYAPGQGLFPKYDGGVYSEGKLDLVVNRGIGNSTIPMRFNNPPEVILVELKCETTN